MKVLIACEESQAVCVEFRRCGHEAYSCDIQECSGGHPEWHIKGDALKLLGRHLIFKTEDGKAHYIDRWDLIIAHPPCTYMSNAGACRMYPKKGQIDEARLAKAMEAKDFFLCFLNADCERIAIENPRPLKVVGLPKETQRNPKNTTLSVWRAVEQAHLPMAQKSAGVGSYRSSFSMEAVCAVRYRPQVGGGTVMERSNALITPKTALRPSTVSPWLWQSNGAVWNQYKLP